MHQLSVIIILITSLCTSTCLNILVYSPAFAASHTNYMARLADTLTDSGHNVTFFVPIADETRRHSLGVKTTKDVYFVEQDEIMKRNIIPIDTNFELFWLKDHDSENAALPLQTFGPVTWETCANLVRNREAFEEMKRRKFDVAILEPLQTCGLGYFHSLGIQNVIIASSCVFYDSAVTAMGEPNDPSYVPSLFSPYAENMNLYERLENYRILDSVQRQFDRIYDNETKICREHLEENIPDWRQLMSSASLHFTNSIPFLDFPRLEYPKTIPIGGISVDIHKIREEKLTEEWNDILEKRDKNILISFGSMTKSIHMPMKFKKNILEVVKKEKDVTFIWKYETNETQWADGVDNVVFNEWVPQTALLNDNRLTAFLTHGGLGSTNELAYTGKPSIMIPLFADQSRNAQMLARHNMSIVLTKRDLGNMDILQRAVHEVLYDSKYTTNARRVSRMLENQPTTPKEIVVKYTEFVGEHGPFHQMTPRSLTMNIVERYNIDFCSKTLSIFCPIVMITTLFMCLPIMFSSGVCVQISEPYYFGSVSISSTYIYGNNFATVGQLVVSSCITAIIIFLNILMIMKLHYKKQEATHVKILKGSRAEKTLTITMIIILIPLFFMQGASITILFGSNTYSYILLIRPLFIDSRVNIVSLYFYCTHPMFKKINNSVTTVRSFSSTVV